MKNRLTYTLIVFFLTGLIAGCSTEKNTRVSRAYHNVTSHYNIYFNGKESLKAGIARIDETVEDDFTRLLPVYKESYPSAGNVASADMDNAILKGSKLIQTHSITKKPKRQKFRTRKYQEFARQEEFNSWIDDSYFLIGQAYFYQHKFVSSSENFSMILRKFPTQELAYPATLWLIRSYNELERFSEANELIQSLQSDKKFPRKLEKELAKVTADMYLKQKDYQEAIKYLDITLKKSHNGREKARIQYILAQLFRETGNEEKATLAFRTVKKFNPTYKMAFNALVNAAGMFSGKGDPVKLKKALQKMLKDEKNIEFRDQIYFALANIWFREGDRPQAVENYRKSVSSSVDNTFQLALSAFTLADIYFEDLNYKNAQAYYDSAMMVVDETYPNYEKLNQRFLSLSRLVEHFTTIEVQDSLQKLALMPENERNALIDKWIAKVQEKKKEEELLASQEQADRGFYRSNEYRMGLGRGDEGGGWYFYNPQTISYGKNQFQQRWGRRKLEDNWRRSNKGIVSDEEMEGFADLADSTKAVVREEDPEKRTFYTQDLPLTDSLMVISHEKIKSALYNAGKILKSDFNDYPRSAKTFEDLNQRYPDNIYLLSTWFDLYDLYELMGNKTMSDNYRTMIIEKFPNSKYARYLLNPNFFVEMEARQDSLNRIYQNAFRDYKAGHYNMVIPQTRSMKKLEPDSLVLPKIDFMEVVAMGATTDLRQMETLLKKYVTDYPKAEPTPLANEIIALIGNNALSDYQKLVDMGYLHTDIKNEELQPGNKPENDEFGGKFSYDGDLIHYFVIAYPRNSGIDINRLKFDIANYNLDHYTKLDFDIEEENLDVNTNLLLVRSLENKEQGLIYFRAIIRQPEVFKTLQNISYFNFIISSTNYREILAEKSITDYLRFYLKNYSRFIGPDFSKEEEPGESPETLMARAKQEDEVLKERGKFVNVDIPVEEGAFDYKTDTTQNFVLAVKDKNLSLRPLLTQFADFNRENFRTWNLASQLKQAGDYQFMIVKGLPGFTEGISYFRKVILERTLFRTLGQISYRNFLITDKNLEVFLRDANVDGYLEFFRTSYIQKTGQSSPSAPVQKPKTGTTAAASPEKKVVTPYSGPYNTSLQSEHYFALIVPVQGFSKADFLIQLDKFNGTDFASSNLKVTEIQLDNFRNIIRISGLTDKDQADLYAQKFLNQTSILSFLVNVNYRSLVITPANYDIFLTRKNITEYSEFYNLIYLNK